MFVLVFFSEILRKNQAMRKLSILDLAFFLAETEGSPKHVAGLMLCQKPAGARPDFCRKLVAELKTHDQPTEPFNLIIHFLGMKGPHWQPCEDFDIDEHVFYHKPKKTISWLEVKDFIARLHEPVMDRTKPLWEYHLVDGIKGSKFAVYTKVHHAYADGMTMARWLDQSLSRSPDDMSLKPAWTLSPRKQKFRKASGSPLTGALRGLTTQAWEQVQTTGGIAKLTAQQGLERLGITRKAIMLPFSAGNNTALTGSSSPGRSIATTSLAMNDVKRLCKATRSTLNHVALTCIDGALHRYLDEHGESISHPLTIQMPVNLRTDNDSKAGNKLGVALVELAEPTGDAYQRHREIGHSLNNVRNHLESVPGDSMQQYTVLVALAGELIGKLNLTDRIPATGHTLVSNLPGPRDSLYVKGAKIEQMYPISTLVPGLRMNITLFSCAGILNFGIVATKDLRDLDSLATYIQEEFSELEEAVLNP
jgi:WS/DGAT/MGAT family acyltransferase